MNDVRRRAIVRDAGRSARRLHVDDRLDHGDGRRAPRSLNARRRETCPASELVVGVQCGGSDAFSGVTANPALGFAADCWCAPAPP
jgi:altronate dehydratase